MGPYLPDVLDRAVNALDVRFRTVLLLIDVDQLTYAEAAEVLQLPLGTVMSRLSRARNRVRGYVRDQAGGGHHASGPPRRQPPPPVTPDKGDRS